MLKTKCTEPDKCKRRKLQLHSFCGRASKEMVSFWDRRELYLVRFKSGKPNNCQTASVRWWEVGGFAGIEVCEFGSKAAKSRHRIQRTQVRIRIKNVSAVYHWGQSQSSSEAVTMPADSFFMLLLMKLSFRCTAGGSSTSWQSTPSSCQRNIKNPTPTAPHKPEPSSKHLLNLQK